MSTSTSNEQRTEETTKLRTDDEAHRIVSGNADSRRRKQILIVASVAVIALIVVALAFLWLRPAREVKTEAPTAASGTGTVKFLMEQQWLIRMKLAQVEEQTVARQITATGRVVPAANKQAVIAPPVSGILAGGQIPRIGQRVAQGQTIAVLQQTATSAEQAQVRAAAASISLENARLEADRRTAAGEVESARVRLDQATKEAARAQRLYERKAFAERQLQAAEADLKAAKAGYDAAV